MRIGKSCEIKTMMIVIICIFVLGTIINNLVWARTYIKKSIEYYGASSDYLISEDMISLLNNTMNNDSDKLYNKGIYALEKAGYKRSYHIILMYSIAKNILIFPVVSVSIGIICFILYRLKKLEYEKGIRGLVRWIKEDTTVKTDFSFLIPIDVLESINSLKYQIKRMEAIHKEDDTKLLQYLEDISHQLKTPLAVIRVVCERTLNKHEEVSETMENALSQVDKMTELIQQLLLLGRFECGKIKADFSYVSPAELMDMLENDYAFLLQEKGITMKIEGNSDNRWFCDEFWIRQILDIVISNAIKHEKHGGKILVSYCSSDIENRITVRDDGLGFANGAEKKIFERFNSTDRTGREGSGLGLAIAKQAINLHFGDISVSNLLPSGAEFNIWFPKLDSNSFYR